MTNQPGIDRRSALGTIAFVGGAGALASRGIGAQQPEAAAGLLSAGWDATKGEYVLPELPYDYGALEPHIDEQTMRIHHGKHHAGYVSGLNKALGKLAEARQSGDAALIAHWSKQASFHGGGHVNHSLFWRCMAPPGDGGGGEPSGTLAGAIEKSFGSFDQFSWQFREAAKAVEGSGWGWLVYEPVGGQLLALQMENQQKLLFGGVVPLLGVDVWEHAYYLKYQNQRAAYVDAFMNVINWPFVQSLYEAATA